MKEISQRSMRRVNFSAISRAALVAFGVGACAMPAMASQWVAAGTLSASNVTGVVALADGRALAVHGTTSEIYNPTTNTWGSLATLNGDHGQFNGASNIGSGMTLTLMGNGKVLLVGNSTCSTAPAAEVYDPTTNTWSVPALPVNGARVAHGAALLKDGRVLIGGGALVRVDVYSDGTTACGASSTTTSEVYDPSTNRWTTSGSMPNGATGGLLSVVLQSGDVMMMGSALSPITSAAQVYSPTTGLWRFTKPTVGAGTATGGTHPIVFHPFLVSGGRVVAVGDCDEPSKGSLCSTVQTYDPTTDAWTAAPAPSTGRGDFSATLGPSGEVIVAGGVVAAKLVGQLTSNPYFVDTDTASVETYSIGNSKWISGGTLPAVRAHHYAVVLKDGRTLIVGGSKGSSSGNIPLNSAVIGTP